MSFVKILLDLRNFFDFLRSKKSFLIAKLVSQNVSHQVSFNGQKWNLIGFALVGNQLSFLGNTSFACFLTSKIVSLVVLCEVSVHGENIFPNRFHHDLQDHVIANLSAKPVRNQNRMEAP